MNGCNNDKIDGWTATVDVLAVLLLQCSVQCTATFTTASDVDGDGALLGKSGVALLKVCECAPLYRRCCEWTKDHLGVESRKCNVKLHTLKFQFHV